MSRSVILASVSIIAVVAATLAGCQATRAGYETAPYRVIRRDGKVQIREYPALKIAETATGGGDFMRLFHYISRENAAHQKISMTTPVFMAGSASGDRTMAFVLPDSLGESPAPKDGNVKVRQLDGGTFAVLRFRGRQQGPDDEAAGRLKAWMRDHQLAGIGEPRFAYFDPPWTPGFLRRNEVMIRIPAAPPVSAGSN